MARLKKFISGYSKKAGQPSKQFTFRVPHRKRLQAITELAAKHGAIITAAWYNVYDGDIKVIDERIK